MLQGLFSFSDQELSAFVLEAECKPSQPDREALLICLLDWMADIVRSDSREPREVETRVLAWLARRLQLPLTHDANNDELEAAVRRKIAEESSTLLFPFLEVGSAIAYLGPAQVIGPKMELLETSLTSLIPSHSTRERLRTHWKARGARLMAGQEHLGPKEVLDALREPIEELQQRSEPTRISVLILSFVVALADGRFEGDEEVFVGEVADRLGIDAHQVREIQQRVSQTFWAQLTALGGGTYQSRSTEEELLLNLRAAQSTLELTGGLASFSDTVEKGFVSAIHRGIENDSALRRGLSRGVKSPLTFPIGFATGMLCYIRERWRSDDQEVLMRVALAAIFRQHLEASGDNVEITLERIASYLPERKVENPAEVLKRSAVGSEPIGQAEVRRISLDPL